MRAEIIMIDSSHFFNGACVAIGEIINVTNMEDDLTFMCDNGNTYSINTHSFQYVGFREIESINKMESQKDA